MVVMVIMLAMVGVFGWSGRGGVERAAAVGRVGRLEVAGRVGRKAAHQAAKGIVERAGEGRGASRGRSGCGSAGTGRRVVLPVGDSLVGMVGRRGWAVVIAHGGSSGACARQRRWADGTGKQLKKIKK